MSTGMKPSFTFMNTCRTWIIAIATGAAGRHPMPGMETVRTGRGPLTGNHGRDGKPS